MTRQEPLTQCKKSIKLKRKNKDLPLTVRDLIRCIKSVLAVATDFDSAIFNRQMPTETEYRKFISSQQNIRLTESDLGLDERISGAVFKREGCETRSGEELYLIYLSKSLNNPLKRVFVLSHEYAHVLLHGRLMHPGMMLNLSSQDWKPDCIAVKQMEAEANIFALMTVIPDALIESVRSQGSTTSETMQFLHTQLINRYSNVVSKKLINDRLLIHKLSYSETWNVSLEDVIDTTGVRSWIFRDANFMSSENRTYWTNGYN